MIILPLPGCCLNSTKCCHLMYAAYVAVVFMGSKKYPKPNDWDVFVKGNGGNSNARTDFEVVCFFPVASLIKIFPIGGCLSNRSCLVC